MARRLDSPGPLYEGIPQHDAAESSHMDRRVFLASLALFSACAFAADNTPPVGFTALFNGKDLSGWRGGDTADHRKLLALPEDARKTMLDGWTADMNKHWKVDNGI